MLKKTCNLIFILFVSFLKGQEEKIVTINKDSLFLNKAEIKFNVTAAIVMIPNIGIEVKLSDKLSYQLDTSAVSYDSMEGSPFHVTQIFNELRFFPKLKEGKYQRSFFIGAHWGYGMYSLRLPKFITSIVDTQLKPEGSFQSGRNTYYGISVGKKIPLKSKKFNLELFIGGGSSQSYYKYYNSNGVLEYDDPISKRNFSNSGEELIYRGGLMIVYKL